MNECKVVSLVSLEQYEIKYNRNPEISTALRKTKSWEPAYSHVLNKNRIDR